MLFWIIGAAALIGIVGLAVIHFAPQGTRTNVYAAISSGLAFVGTMIGFLLDQQGDLAAVGLDAKTIAMIILAAKAADWLIQRTLRSMTTTPVGMDQHPDTIALAAAIDTATQVAPAQSGAIMQAAETAKVEATNA